jgi:hypothetical protein
MTENKDSGGHLLSVVTGRVFAALHINCMLFPNPNILVTATLLTVTNINTKGIVFSLRVFENRVLRRIFGPKRDEVTGECRKMHKGERNNLFSSPSIVRVINF